MISGIVRPIHLIGIVFAVALLYQSIRLVRKRKGTVFEFLLWSSFGIFLLLLSLGDLVTLLGIYELISTTLRLLGFGSGVTGLLVISNLSLLMMLFYTFVKVKTNRKQIYDLNQEIALVELEQDDD